MKKTLILSLLLFSTSISYGQDSTRVRPIFKSGPRLKFEVLTTPILSQNFVGGGMSFLFPVKPRFSMGMSITGLQKQIDNKFNYSMGQPILTSTELGLVGQYNVVENQRLTMGFSVTAGYSNVNLADNDDKVRFRTRYGYGYNPRTIANNDYFLLSPGFEAAYKVLSSQKWPNLYLALSVKDRYLFGKTNFGVKDNFSNHSISLGITMTRSANPRRRF